MREIHGTKSLKVGEPALASLRFSIIGRQGELLDALIPISLFLIPSIIGRQGELLHARIPISLFLILGIIGRQGELLHALISISLYSHS